MSTKQKGAKYKVFGEELRRLREAQGIATQTKLAKLFGVAQQTVTRWEAGHSRPRAEQMAVIAKALNTSQEGLLVAAGHASDEVTVSFDQPLPLASLSAEGFQRFCRTLLESLYPGATVHAAGKTGHKQFGIDLEVTFTDGTAHTFQCKREAQFGAAKVRAAVKAHTVKATRKVILLSRVASPLARREVRAHRGWDIWDQDDLSEKLRSLSIESKRRIVDTYFPGQRFALLGEPSPGPWVTPGSYFSSLLAADRPFSHHWTLVGRTTECAKLASLLADHSAPVIALVGPAGGGKSRVMRSAIDAFLESHCGHTVLMLSPTEPVTMKSLEDLGTGKKLLVVDDAHDRTDLELIVRYIANPQMHARLLLAYRPYAEEHVGRELARYGISATTVTLEKPTKSDAVMLASQVLESLEGPIHAAKLIADVAYDSPLSVVVGAWIVATDGLHPELFAPHDVFQRTVLSRYQEAIERSVSRSNKDQELLRSMLRVIALIQPLVPDDAKVLKLYQDIEGVSAPDATRLSKLLIASGVLFKRGARYRLSPDLLADSIIESAYITVAGGSNGEAERAFEAAIPEHKAHLLLNLGRLDWRRNKGDTSESPLLGSLWQSLKWHDDYINAHVNAAVEAAYFQPRHALAFARRLIDDGHGTHEGVCRMIRNAGYSLKHLRDAAVLLWELAREDDRETNPHPNHPLRLLAEIAAPEPRKSIAYVEGVVDVMLSVMPFEESWVGRRTPFDVIEGALATEGHFTSRATSRSITFSAYGVDIEAVRPVRRRIVDTILESLTSDHKRQAYEAAKALQHAIHGPIGLMNRRASEEEQVDWESEFADTLERVNRLIEETSLAPVIMLRVAESVGWLAHHGNEATRSPAARILSHLDRDLTTRVTRVLMDGWGTQTWRHDAGRMDRNDEIHQQLARELTQALPDPQALASFLNERLVDLKSYAAETRQSSHIFVNRLLRDAVGLAQVVLNARDRSPQSPIAEFAAVALGVVIRSAKHEANQRIDALLAEDERALSIVAQAYTMGLDKGRDLTAFDRHTLRRIFTSSDPAVLSTTSWLFRDVAERDKQFAIELLVNASPAIATETRHDIFMWFDDDKLIPFDVLSDDELKGIFKLFSVFPTLDNHFVHGFLVRVAKRSPRLVVELAQERVTQSVSREDWWKFGLIGGMSRHVPSINVLDHPDGPMLLREVLDWALPQIGEYRFAHHLSGLVTGVFGLLRPSCTSVLESWCTQGTSEHFKLLAHVLRDTPHAFAFDERAFVIRMLKKARSLGTSVHRNLSSSLYASAISGVRSGTAGEPLPRDLELKAQAEEVLSSLSAGDPAFELYDDLRKHALNDIERSKAEGRAMDEEDAETD
jgi:transcriptional regulator with XRE-family HTH domain